MMIDEWRLNYNHVSSAPVVTSVANPGDLGCDVR